jgi:hypothetical protein
MIHFFYLIAFAFFVSVVFGAISDGEPRARILYGAKTFLQFIVVSLVLAWVLYFIPW